MNADERRWKSGELYRLCFLSASIGVYLRLPGFLASLARKSFYCGSKIQARFVTYRRYQVYC